MSKFRRMLVDNKGFTLIELLVVIAVLGILAAIAIPRLTGFTDRARVSNLESSGQTVRSNIELYLAENSDFSAFASYDELISYLTNEANDVFVNIDEDYTLGAGTDPAFSSTSDSYHLVLTDTGSSYYADIKSTGVTVTQ